MIFHPVLIRKIAAGTKTQTRRVVKPGESTCRYRPGREYAVQPKRGGRGVGRIEILEARQEELGVISFLDARAEGFRSRKDFFDYWRELRGDVDLELMVWVISFRWVERRRLLHRDSSHGYTSNPALALPDEPEAVDEDTQDRISREREAESSIQRERQRRRTEQFERERRLLDDRLGHRARRSVARHRDSVNRQVDRAA